MKKVLGILLCVFMLSIIAYTNADASTIHFHEFEYHYLLGDLIDSDHNYWTIEIDDGLDDVFHYHYTDEYYYSIMPETGKRCLSSEYNELTIYLNYQEIFSEGEWTFYDDCPGE